jgi:hypothetical protein
LTWGALVAGLAPAVSAAEGEAAGCVLFFELEQAAAKTSVSAQQQRMMRGMCMLCPGTPGSSPPVGVTSTAIVSSGRGDRNAADAGAEASNPAPTWVLHLR